MPVDLYSIRRLTDRLGDDALAFAPEGLVAITTVLLLAARLIPMLDRLHRVTAGLIAAAVALAIAIVQWLSIENGKGPGPIFDGLLTIDPFAIAIRILVLAALVLTLLLNRATNLPDRDDSADYTVLLFGSALGLLMMASAHHLLVAVLAIEMASLPSYALTGFLKGRGRASEAALKYALFGATASGIMLYGVSLLTARIGSGDLAALTKALAVQLEAGSFDMPTAAGLLLVGAGVGYKLSVVPFHVWLPDAFEGAAAEVAAWLSVASKAAAVGLLARLALTISHAVPKSMDPSASIGLGLAVIAAITTTYGNLMAYAQTNLNRLLGYSTIAHAGVLLAGVATLRRDGLTAVLIYLAAYLLANFGAFAVVAAIRLRRGREDVQGVDGLMSDSPALGVALAMTLASLLGLPPLAGFAGKFAVFSAMAELKDPAWRVLLFIMIANTAISAGYYFILIRRAAFEEAPSERSGQAPTPLKVIALTCGVASLLLGVLWNPLVSLASAAVGGLK